MLENVRNLLYEHPDLYERVYPEPNDETPTMCRRFFERYLSSPPCSIIDIGCGTGRDLNSLSCSIPDCFGVDALPAMIDLARARFPHIGFCVGDMRGLRLHRGFDAIVCMRSAFMYALTNAEVAATLETFAAHAREGTLLILDINNAATYLPGGKFRDTIEVSVDDPEFSAKARSVYSFDRRRQRLVRQRTWTIEGSASVEDYCEYRLFFPAELEHLLELHGFRMVGMFDNLKLRDTDLAGDRLYVAAKYGAKP